MNYKFSYKRFFFWHSFMVEGHRYEEKQDKMILFFKDGSIREIKEWAKCEAKLGSDWFIQTHKEMEQSIGQSIPVGISKN